MALFDFLYKTTAFAETFQNIFGNSLCPQTSVSLNAIIGRDFK